jgi:hypothetical protein
LSPLGNRPKADKLALCGLGYLADAGTSLEQLGLKRALDAEDGQDVGRLGGFIVEPMAPGTIK